jgi:hypothetical protein
MIPIEAVHTLQMDLIRRLYGAIDLNQPCELILGEIVALISVSANPDQMVFVRVKVDEVESLSPGFKETPWFERLPLELPDENHGFLDIFYPHDTDPHESFFSHDFLHLLGHLISGYISEFRLKRLFHDNNERIKELKSISLTNLILQKHSTLEEALQEVCSLLPEAWQYPEDTVARITFNDQIFESRGFKETPWRMNQFFETPDHKEGRIDIFYLKEFPPAFEGPFLKEERTLLNILGSIISGTSSNRSLRELLVLNTERLKELRGINRTSEVLKESPSFEDSLQKLCNILPESWKYPELTVIRIKFDNKEYTSPGFKETEWKQSQDFESPGGKKGLIEVFLLKECPKEDDGPFLKEEKDLLINLSNLISGSAGADIFNRLLSENKERLKELRGINKTSQLIAESRPVEETLQSIAHHLCRSWQYPRQTRINIHYEGMDYKTAGFRETSWSQKENFVTIDNKKGYIQVVYLKEFPKAYEGPFLKEERELLANIGKLVTGYLNNSKGRDIYRRNIHKKVEIEKQEEYKKSLVTNKQPLQLFFNQQVLDKYIYLEMMKYKVKEILFVATLYDAFILESEDGFFERFMGEIYQYSLFSLPRITGVTTASEALEMMETKSFDLVVIMVGIDRDAPLALSEQIKEKAPSLPVYLLLNQKRNIKFFEEMVDSSKTLDKLFFWNGDSQIIFAIVKSIEDKANVANDTKVGLVRVILLVEDSSLYYSKYLQILYAIVFGQVQKLLPEVEKNELDKICKMRSRPKILLARNYEDAMHLYNQYKDYLLCVISDIEYEKGGTLDKTAGLKFIKYVKSHMLNVPIILQSSENKNIQKADDLGVYFINKNSESLLNDLTKYLNDYLGFGDFIFRDKAGNQIGRARTLKEFEEQLAVVPNETFYLHACENQYSIWLMARGEIQLAKAINPLRIGSMEDVLSHRSTILEMIKEYRETKKRGKILRFDEALNIEEKNIITFADGSLGGKGRGLAFINTLIYNFDFASLSGLINIRTPKTVIIGTDEFDHFIRHNQLYELIIGDRVHFDVIKEQFLLGQLSPSLEEKLVFFLEHVRKPIAIRSSSLSEDSFTQPFAGVFHTYIIPNCEENREQTLENLKQGIKLVFASVYSSEAKSYFKVTHHKAEDEKMAVVLQELVGQQHGDYYYPHISGTACSYNYYPVAHMKPEEGFAMAALGLGSYVVDGMNSYRFSPVYPNVDMYSVKDLIHSSQVKFYALDCRKNNRDYAREGELASLALLDISEAEKHGTLKHCASVYDQQNDRVVPGLSIGGPRILNFANILKYDYVPLAKTIEVILNIIKEALGAPIEIEYALDLHKADNGLPTFYLLQTKPIVDSQARIKFDINQFDKSKTLLYTKTSLGNGEIQDIYDVIYIDNEHFNNLKTLEMAGEIEYLNRVMVEQNKQYILIGPGRWGTRDPFLGIPVNWAQISNAKIIVEISLENFPLDSSLGSHFFHNVTSMNIGYFSVNQTTVSEFVNWESLNKQEEIHRTQYFRHVRFDQSLRILMDGKIKESVVLVNG